jgi:hypothetical protein
MEPPEGDTDDRGHDPILDAVINLLGEAGTADCDRAAEIDITDPDADVSARSKDHESPPSADVGRNRSGRNEQQNIRPHNWRIARAVLDRVSVDPLD